MQQKEIPISAVYFCNVSSDVKIAILKTVTEIVIAKFQRMPVTQVSFEEEFNKVCKALAGIED